MNLQTLDTSALAMYLVENIEKENIISEIFNLFRFECMDRCNINPVLLDERIREFENNEQHNVQLLETIIHMIKDNKENVQKKEKELIQSIVSYISAHFTSDITIEKIAEELNISYYYMCHIFKNTHGISVSQFRTQKRMELAMKKLVESSEKISEIALSCGFNSISYFTEIFSKTIGMSPTQFRIEHRNTYLHDFYDFHDMFLTSKLNAIRFLDENISEIKDLDFKMYSVHEPDEQFSFLHESAIIEYHGVLYASWYNNPRYELNGYTPICGKKSYDQGKTWSDLEIICEDKTEKILYCPPVYGIDDDKLYLFVNQMVAADHMHSLDLYILNTETDKFEFLWSRPIPFKLNTNIVALPNGKLMLPGRVGELDGFPITPAVLISDSGKIDSDWRLVKITETGDLPDGKKLVFPEISVISVNKILYMFNRNDQRRVPLVYQSNDLGETWSTAYSHDIPYISSKIYTGKLSDGRNYLIANVEQFSRSKLAIYFSKPHQKQFDKRLILFDKETTLIPNACACHYPSAYESNGNLYIIATLSYQNEDELRGAVLFVLPLKDMN